MHKGCGTIKALAKSTGRETETAMTPMSQLLAPTGFQHCSPLILSLPEETSIPVRVSNRGLGSNGQTDLIITTVYVVRFHFPIPVAMLSLFLFPIKVYQLSVSPSARNSVFRQINSQGFLHDCQLAALIRTRC